MRYTIVKLLISGSIFMAGTAMAGSPQRYEHHNAGQPHSHHHAAYQRHWQTGQYLPSHYHSTRYQVDPRYVRHLPRATRHQQWYRIDQHYVLVDTRNHRVVRTYR